MGGQSTSGSNLSRLKSVARGLYENLQQMEQECSDEAQRQRVLQTMAKSRELFLQMKNFVSGVLHDLDSTREQLNQGSDQVLGQVREQLDKVNESTQDAVQSVLNRIDSICERQNDVFNQLAELKEKLGELENGKQDCAPLVGIADRLEALEGEIQMEAFEIMNEMQFQDIASQQLQQANQLLNEAKGKLTDFNKMLNLFKSAAADSQVLDPDREGKPRTHDPGATMKEREHRQQIADDIEADYSNKD